MAHTKQTSQTIKKEKWVTDLKIKISNYISIHPGMYTRVAAHSRTLAWKIPWTEEPGGRQSTGSQRVGHD